MEYDLKCCKHCRSDNWLYWITSDNTCYLECDSCGYRTKEYKTELEACEEWNERIILSFLRQIFKLYFKRLR